MRKFIVGLCMLMIMVSIGSGYWWDTEKILQGRQNVGYRRAVVWG